ATARSPGRRPCADTHDRRADRPHCPILAGVAPAPPIYRRKLRILNNYSSRLNVDLHCHSTVSDGVLTPTDVARRAHANGVQLWALTDHDEVSGVQSAREVAIEAGMQFLTGVEVSVTWAGQTVHIVGLNIEVTHEALNAGLARLRSAR